MAQNVIAKTISWLLFLLLVLPVKNRAQDVQVLLKEAQQLESGSKDAEALQKYLEVIRLQPNQLHALVRVSELYNTLGKRQTSKDKQKEYYRTAKTYAQKALQVNGNSADANFVMAMAMGRMALISSGEEKINAVKDIKTYAEKTIKLDPNNFKGYHILGKWYYEVSNLTSLEKWLVKLTYGALPKATLEDAILHFEKSKNLHPQFLLNYLELARCWHRKDNDKKAIELLENMLKMQSTGSDDATVKTEGKKLLEQLKD